MYATKELKISLMSWKTNSVLLAIPESGMKFRTDDDYLLRFLRCGKFKHEAAYEKIRFICKNRKQYPEVFCNLPSNFEELLNRNMFIYLPYRDEEGSIILVDKFGKFSTHL